MSSELKHLYDTQGFVIVPNLITHELLPKLQYAAESAIADTRSGKWSYRRTVGRHFPPYGEDNPDSWGVQHLMHPDLGQSVFAEWYTSDPLIDAVKELLECGEDDLQMGECCEMVLLILLAMLKNGRCLKNCSIC